MDTIGCMAKLEQPLYALAAAVASFIWGIPLFRYLFRYLFYYSITVTGGLAEERQV